MLRVVRANSITLDMLALDAVKKIEADVAASGQSAAAAQDAVTGNHLAIIDALERRDSAAAVAAVAYHCDRTRHWWGVAA